LNADGTKFALLSTDPHETEWLELLGAL
jgi:hypothetical protein